MSRHFQISSTGKIFLVKNCYPTTNPPEGPGRAQTPTKAWDVDLRHRTREIQAGDLGYSNISRNVDSEKVLELEVVVSVCLAVYV